jgi:hypothetical protein
MCRESSDDRADLRLTRGYVELGVVPADHKGSKTVSLARFGEYEVRLVEVVPANRADATPMWLELYSHETKFGIDSCRCYDLEAAVQATEELISRARKLDEEARGVNCQGQC